MSLETPPERILIVKLSALGDVVHALPTAAALREAFPAAQIDWVVEPLAAPIVEACPVLDHVFVAPKQVRWRRFLRQPAVACWSLCRVLRTRRYDLALDLQGLTKSSVLAALSGARRRVGYNWLRELAPLLLERSPRRPESIHIVDQLLDVARYLGADPKEVRFPLILPPSAVTNARIKLSKAGLTPEQPFLVLNPTDGGGGGAKGLPVETMVQLVNAVGNATGLPWVLVGASSDRARAEGVQTAARVPLYSLVGQTTVLELAAVIQVALVHVSGDSGSAHIAAALGTPPVTVYGRSNPARVGPYGFGRFVVDARGYCSGKCRRYHQKAEINKPAICLSGRAECMNRVPASEIVPVVLRAVEERLRAPMPCHVEAAQAA